MSGNKYECDKGNNEWCNKSVEKGYKYKCLSSNPSKSCNKMYEIHDYKSWAAAGAPHEYGGSFYFNSYGKVEEISGGKYYESKGTNSYDQTSSGIYKSVDNDGATYYYRGKVNNYIKLSDSDTNLWQIMRLNGDKTLRLISTNALTGEKADKVSGFDGRWTYIEKTTKYKQVITPEEINIIRSAAHEGWKYDYIYIAYSDNIEFNESTGKYTLKDPSTKKYTLNSASMEDVTDIFKNKYVAVAYFKTNSSSSDSNYYKDESEVYKVGNGNCNVNYNRESNNGSVDLKFSFKCQGTKYTSQKETTSTLKDSNLKLALDDYYTTIKSNYDDIIAVGKYCMENPDEYIPPYTMDVDVGNDVIINASVPSVSALYSRLNYKNNNIAPRYTCSKNSVINSKIGTVTADDVVFARAVSNYDSNSPYYVVNWEEDPNYVRKLKMFKENKNNVENGFYLYRDNGFITLSNDSKFCKEGFINLGGENSCSDDSIFYDCKCTSTNKVYPVINIRSDISFKTDADGKIIGNETKDNPYILTRDGILCMKIDLEGKIVWGTKNGDKCE